MRPQPWRPASARDCTHLQDWHGKIRENGQGMDLEIRHVIPGPNGNYLHNSWNKLSTLFWPFGSTLPQSITVIYLKFFCPLNWFSCFMSTWFSFPRLRGLWFSTDHVPVLTVPDTLGLSSSGMRAPQSRITWLDGAENKCTISGSLLEMLSHSQPFLYRQKASSKWL